MQSSLRVTIIFWWKLISSQHVPLQVVVIYLQILIVQIFIFGLTLGSFKESETWLWYNKYIKKTHISFMISCTIVPKMILYDILLVKNFAGIEIRTHNLLTDVDLLQSFVRSTSIFTSWASSDSQNSGGPGSHYSHQCGHLQTVPEPVHSDRVIKLDFAIVFPFKTISFIPLINWFRCTLS